MNLRFLKKLSTTSGARGLQKFRYIKEMICEACQKEKHCQNFSNTRDDMRGMSKRKANKS